MSALPSLPHQRARRQHENKTGEKRKSRGSATTPAGTEVVRGCGLALQDLCPSLALQPGTAVKHFVQLPWQRQSHIPTVSGLWSLSATLSWSVVMSGPSDELGLFRPVKRV